MKVQLWNKLVDIAKTKENGVYTKEGWKYFVKNGNIGYVGNKSDGIFKIFGIFRTPIWTPNYSKDSYERLNDFNIKIKELRKMEQI